MNCLGALLAFFVGLLLFLILGFAITSWWGALIVAAALLVIVARRVWRAPRIGAHRS